VVGNQPADSIIIYATAAGDTAADGEGRNGLFTSHLLKNLKTPGLEVNEIFRRTGGDVARASGGAQRPAVYISFYESAYLGSKPAPAPVTSAPVQAAPKPAPVQTPAPAPAQTAQQQPAVAVNQQSDKVYKIGERGPAGGWIFYDKGKYKDGWRYLEAAPVEKEFLRVEWGLYKTKIWGTGTSVGTGKQNTRLIIDALQESGESGKAAQLCAALDVNGYKDWFLPSKDELDLMYKNLKAKELGEFSMDWITNSYWSSSQYDGGSARKQDFSTGLHHYNLKNGFNSVKAVRAF
jgi:hypothetical protein